MKKLLKKHRLELSSLIIIIFLFLLTLSINHFPLLYNYIHSTLQESASPEINAWLAFVTGAATAVLSAIAWFKFSGFYNQNQANFLLRIDERWSSPEAIKARIIIHDLYIQVQKENEDTITTLKNALHTRDAFIQSKVGEKIIEMRKETCKKEEFIYLLNFLDFMETIGYIASKEHVKVDELDALCGESLMFNYTIFKPYIEDKRDRHQNKRFYENFDILYKNLREILSPKIS